MGLWANHIAETVLGIWRPWTCHIGRTLIDRWTEKKTNEEVLRMNKEVDRNDSGSKEELDKSCAERRWFNVRNNGGLDDKKERQT